MLGTADELAKLVGPNFVLFLGNGPRHQYRDVDAVMASLRPALREIPECGPSSSWVAVFGGDTADPNQPDVRCVSSDAIARNVGGAKTDPTDIFDPRSAEQLGIVMQRLKEEWKVPLCAVVGWDDVDAHCDYAYRYDSQVCEETGRTMYGGFSGTGKAVGGTAVYLGDAWMRYLRAVVAIEPVGCVGSAEAAFVRDATDLRIVDVPAQARFPPTPKSA